MRLLFIICCLPLFTLAQYSGRQDDSLRKISDTMRFPEPFTFKDTATTNLSETALIKKCYGWLDFLEDSIKSIVVVKDSVHNTATASNVPATADISFTIFLKTDGTKYLCALQDFIFHTVNSKMVPLAKATRTKDYRETAKIEKVLIMRNYQWVFNSLHAYLQKNE